VAVNILELAMSPGLEVVAAAGGLAAFTGWRGALCGVVLAGDPGQPSRGGANRHDGWRARRLPVVEAEDGGRITVRSPIDGTLHDLDRAALLLQAAELGAASTADVLPGGELHWWRSSREPAPAGWVVSAVPADAAREGLYWSAATWQRIDATLDAADDRRLDPGCPCRACRVARLGYIAHLWRQHEITASHLLGWHNLHQARLLVEGA
jgi:hypothetical protein